MRPTGKGSSRIYSETSPRSPSQTLRKSRESASLRPDGFRLPCVKNAAAVLTTQPVPHVTPHTHTHRKKSADSLHNSKCPSRNATTGMCHRKWEVATKPRKRLTFLVSFHVASTCLYNIHMPLQQEYHTCKMYVNFLV